MAKCELTGKAAVAKNQVSHSNIKTKSRAFPNIQSKRFFSYQLNRSIKLKVATSTIRDVDKLGGFDDFIMKQPSQKLSKKALTVKRGILKKTRRNIPQQKPQEKQ